MRDTQADRSSESTSNSIPLFSGDIISSKKQDTHGNDTRQPRRRLTLADHPLAVGRTPGGTDSGALETATGEPDWSISLMTGQCQDSDDSKRSTEARKATKSVLVLNGAACFIAGKLASTGEPRVRDRVSRKIVGMDTID